MWNGYPGQINTATHKAELSSPEGRPIHVIQYRAGPKAREVEKEEADKMLMMKVIEPVQTELASTIVFVPKRIEPNGFA